MIEIIFPTIPRWHCIDLMLKNIQAAHKPDDIQVLAVVSGDDEYAQYVEDGFKKIFDRVRIVRNDDVYIEHDKLRERQYESQQPDLDVSVKKLLKVYQTYTLAVQNADKKADYYWIMEDDTLFPLDTYDRYMQVMDFMGGDIVTGISYYWHTGDTGKRNFWKVHWKKTDKTYDVKLTNMEDCDDGIVKLGASGLGNVICKREALLTWTPKTFLSIKSGADISFFINALERNYPAYGLCNLSLPHITRHQKGAIEIKGKIEESLIPLINGKG